MPCNDQKRITTRAEIIDLSVWTVSCHLALAEIIMFRARIPVSNAVTAMEVWLLACMMLVFFSLVEYTIILRKSVHHNRVLEKMKKEPNYPRTSNGVLGPFKDFSISKIINI